MTVPDQAIRQQIIARARRIVIKVGTNGLTDRTGRLDTEQVASLSGQIAALLDDGVDVTLVASGAIGAGLAELDLPTRPKTLPELQAVAAVGQGQLMRAFHDALVPLGRCVGQVLLSRDDFEHRGRYLNIRNTLCALHELGSLAILNENDAVATEELDTRYGDNDIIAAHVTNMLQAEVLVLLTSVDGVLDQTGAVIDVIEQVDDKAIGLAGKQRSSLGSGGMAAKIAAAGLVTAAGEAVVIANARTPDVLPRLRAGEKLGTVFLPADRKLSSKRRWIGQAARPEGTIRVDAGAARALRERGKSLLPSGMTAIEGTFEKGATVSIVDPDGREIARGLTSYASAELLRIAGLRSEQIEETLGQCPTPEAVHRNNMTVL
jgi:glutamate 5-kinase